MRIPEQLEGAICNICRESPAQTDPRPFCMKALFVEMEKDMSARQWTVLFEPLALTGSRSALDASGVCRSWHS